MTSGMIGHGAWLDTRAISVNSGGRSSRPCSARSNTDRLYWSGMLAQPRSGPR